MNAYHGGKLPPDMRTQVESHLASCNECRSIYAADIVVSRVIDLEKEQGSNPYLASRIMSAIEAQNESTGIIPTRGRILKPVFLTLSLAATVFLGIVIGNIPGSGTMANDLPLELTLIDDASIESIDFLLNE